MYAMLQIHTRSLEPFSRIHGVICQSYQHRATVDQASVVHRLSVEIRSRHGWKTQRWNDKEQPCDCHGTHWLGELAEIPGTRSELVSCEEELESDGCLSNVNPIDSRRMGRPTYHESDVLPDADNAEDSSNCDRTSESKQTRDGPSPKHKPNAIHRCLRLRVHLGPELATRNRTVSTIRKHDSRGRDSDTLADKELRNDVDGEHRKSRLLAQDLNAQRSHWLTVLTSDNIGNVFDGVHDDEDDSEAEVET